MSVKPKNRIQQFFSNRFCRILFYVFLGALVLNLLTVNTADDLGYTISSGLFDIFQREIVQYMTWTGRSVAHIIARIFLALPKGIFDLANSACFAYLIWMIYCHATGSKNTKHPVLLVCIALMVFLFAPFFGQTCLWETGSCNYLWTTAIVLTFLLPYRVESTEERKSSKWLPIGMLLFGIVAGWTNENTAGALILMVLVFLFITKKKTKKVPVWMWTGLVGTLLGFAIMILAPGNAIRSAEFVSEGGKMYTLVHDFHSFFEVLFGAEGSLRYACIFFAVALALSIFKKGKNTWIAICYGLSAIAAVGAIILTPVPVLFDRSMFGATIFLIIGICISISELLDSNEEIYPKGLVVLASVLGCFAVYHYFQATVHAVYIRYQYQNRESYVASQKANGNLNPVVPLYDTEFEDSYSALYGLNDITPYPLYWVNSTYSQLHDLESVQSAPLDQWSKVYKNGDATLMNVQDMQEYLDTVSKNPSYLLLVTSSSLDTTKYSEQVQALKSIGLDIQNQNYICAIVQGNKVLDQYIDSQEGSLESSVEGHYIYLSSMASGELSDVLVDNVEYSNDNPGITFVVYDTQNQQAVDSVTWNADSEIRCTRYKIEK